MRVMIEVPTPSRGLWGNVVGIAGLVAVCAAIAVLSSWPWGLLAGGVFAVGLAALAGVSAPRAVEPRPMHVVSKPAKASRPEQLLG